MIINWARNLTIQDLHYNMKNAHYNNKILKLEYFYIALEKKRHISLHSTLQLFTDNFVSILRVCVLKIHYSVTSKNH